MNCETAQQYLSALYDSESVPAGVAEHAAICNTCQALMNDYAQMGADLRVAAALEIGTLPRFALPSRRHPFAFLWRRMMIPRYVLAALLAAMVALPVGVSLLRAQSRPLWFEFGYTWKPEQPIYHYFGAKAGFDDSSSTLGYVGNAPAAANIRVKIEYVAEDHVVLRIRSTAASMEPVKTGFQIGSAGGGEVSLEHAPTYDYTPGETLPIPVEGGGVLYLKGRVLDHQPKIAFGYPLEPPAGTLVFRSPALSDTHRLMGQSEGSSALTTDGAINLNTAEGMFRFSLHSFRNAVEGKADWGKVEFQLNGVRFVVRAAAPVTGGDQPVPVWVRRDPPESEGFSVGSGPVPQ